MRKPEIHVNEEERLKALKEYSILDTLPEKEYEDITYLASYICETPISLVTLVDTNRQWFKSNRGLDVTETSRDSSFCAHAITNDDEIFIIPDSREDERFHDNPLVTGEPHVIFYAGVKLMSDEGYPLGTLCVIDQKPKKLDESQIKALKALANQVTELLDKRKKSNQLKALNEELKLKNDNLDNFARVAAHDMKTPLNNIVILSQIFHQDYGENIDEKAVNLINHIENSSRRLSILIDEILKYSQDTSLYADEKEPLNIHEIIDEVLVIADPQKETNLSVKDNFDSHIFSNRIALKQIFLNIIVNSIKYNDKEKTEVTITLQEDEEYHKIVISDNGPGINERDLGRIFKVFQTTDNRDRDGERGSGIGLATVKKIIDSIDGQIKVESQIGQGLTTIISIPKPRNN